MNISAEQILAVATLLGTVFTGFAALVAAWKINKVAAVADVIAVHVNSAADAARKKIDEKQAELDAAHQIIADQQQAAAMLAQLKEIMAHKAPADTGP